MYQFERKKQMLNYINEKEKASVEELSSFFNVSKVTVRRDLDELVEMGLVNKQHGGVISIDSSLNLEIPYDKKSGINTEEKKKIGAAACRLIEDGDVIILDAGSTTLEIASRIENKNVTAITNDIKVAMELACKPNITLMITGGTVEKSVYTITGPDAENFLSKIHVHKTFLGADAISLEYGITNRTLQEVSIKRAMMNAADKIIVVADYSKLNRKVFATLCSLKEIDTLIIDKIDEGFKKILCEMGVEIIIA